MMETFMVNGYTLTDNTQLIDEFFGFTPEIASLINELGMLCQEKGSNKIVKRIQSAIYKYPQIPHFRNYLAVAYSALENMSKANLVIEQTLIDFPDYLYAKLNAASIALKSKRYEKVKKLLGDTLELRDLYPNRQIFHKDELYKYLETVLDYHCELNDIEEAEKVFKTIAALDPDVTDSLAFFQIGMLRLKTATERFKKQDALKWKVNETKKASDTKGTSPVVLVHPEIKELYRYDFRIPKETISEILSLPRESLLKDLELLLDDAVNRYSQLADKAKYEEAVFVLHSFFLLMELNSVESLPRILSFLEYERNFIDFWMGDHISETVWQCIYKLGFDQTDKLKQFLLKPGLYTFSKLVVTAALAQMYLHNTEKRDEVEAIFSEVLDVFSKASADDNLIDSDFLGFCICDIMKCRFVNLLPKIKIFFDKNQIPLEIGGDYQDIESKISKSIDEGDLRKPLSIYQIYEDVVEIWYGYNNEEDGTVDYSAHREIQTKTQAVTQDKNIGRNDPCPCGSGKKYKKCCMNM